MLDQEASKIGVEGVILLAIFSMAKKVSTDCPGIEFVEKGIVRYSVKRLR